MSRGYLVGLPQKDLTTEILGLRFLWTDVISLPYKLYRLHKTSLYSRVLECENVHNDKYQVLRHTDKIVVLRVEGPFWCHCLTSDQIQIRYPLGVPLPKGPLPTSTQKSQSQSQQEYLKMEIQGEVWGSREDTTSTPETTGKRVTVGTLRLRSYRTFTNKGENRVSRGGTTGLGQVLSLSVLRGCKPPRMWLLSTNTSESLVYSNSKP